MAQLPSLSNLFLGVPTAGNSKKGRGKERKKAKEEEASSLYEQRGQELSLDFADAFWHYRKEFLEQYNVYSLDGEEMVLPVLREVMKYRYTQSLMNNWVKMDPTLLYQTHSDICKQLRLGKSPSPWPYSGDELVVDKMLQDEFERAAEFVYKNFILRTGIDEPERSYDERYRLLNDWDMSYQLGQYTRAAYTAMYEMYEDDSVFLVRTKHYWVRLESRLWDNVDDATDRRAAQPPATRTEERAPRPARAPEAPKDRSEYERLAKLNDEREKREAEEELARKFARDAEVSQSRAEASAKAKREEEEREDALRRQEGERNKGAGSSRGPWPQEPLSPGSAAKQLVEAQRAQEAKQQDIEAKRERIRLAVEAKKKEMAEQQRLEDEMERARQVANVYKSGAAAPEKKGGN